MKGNLIVRSDNRGSRFVVVKCGMAKSVTVTRVLVYKAARRVSYRGSRESTSLDRSLDMHQGTNLAIRVVGTVCLTLILAPFLQIKTREPCKRRRLAETLTTTTRYGVLVLALEEAPKYGVLHTHNSSLISVCWPVLI